MIRGRSDAELDLLAVDRGDHVAAVGCLRVALEGDRALAGLEAGLVGGAALDHLGDQRAGIDVEVELARRAAGRAPGC